MNWPKSEKLTWIAGSFVRVLKMRKRENEAFECGKYFTVWLVGLPVLLIWHFSHSS